MSNFLINKHFTHVGNNQFFSSFPHDNILSCLCSPKPLTHLHPFIKKKLNTSSQPQHTLHLPQNQKHFFYIFQNLHSWINFSYSPLNLAGLLTTYRLCIEMNTTTIYISPTCKYAPSQWTCHHTPPLPTSALPERPSYHHIPPRLISTLSWTQPHHYTPPRPKSTSPWKPLWYGVVCILGTIQ